MRIERHAFWIIGLLAISGPLRAQESAFASTFAIGQPVSAAPPWEAQQPIINPSPETPLANLLTNADFHGFFLTGDYLLVRPIRQGLNLGLLVPNSATPRVGEVESLSWDYSSGFRIGGGYRLNNGWELATYFTYFHAADNRTLTAPPGGAFYPNLSPTTTGAVGSADGDNDLTYSVFDLEAAKRLSCGDDFSLRVFGGIRFARINQSLKTVYSGGVLGTTSDYVQSPVRFSGTGLTGGLEGTWQISNGWGIYGRGRVSLIAGQFNDPLIETIDSGTPTVSVANRTDAVVPVGELGAGLSYTGSRFLFSTGYDLADWFNMINGQTISGHKLPGTVGYRKSDLMLEAVTFKFGFNF